MDYESGYFSFVSGFKGFFAYYLCRYIKSVFQDSKSLRNHKTVEIKFFLYIFLLVDGTDLDPDLNKQLRIRIWEARSLTDPTDSASNPKHWLKQKKLICLHIFAKLFTEKNFLK
jgi:hypothetical protein